MAKYRKKPVVIEATQFQSSINARNPELEELDRICTELNVSTNNFAFKYDQPYVHTKEGALKIKPGDWIIKGIKGEVYPCDDEIFRQTYEAIET